MRQLQDQLDSLERQSNEVTDRNKDEELRLRKEKSRAEHSLASKIASYDEDMEVRRKELEELTQAFSADLKEYEMLREYFDKIDANLARESEENFILDAVIRREAFAVKIFFMAANKIQNIARGRQARARVNAMKSKGKKGKGGGKKK